MAYTIHLLLPIESRTLTKLYNPLDQRRSMASPSSCPWRHRTVEAYVDDDGAGRRPLLGTLTPHNLQPLCHDAELWRSVGGKEGVVVKRSHRIREGGASLSFSAVGDWVALQARCNSDTWSTHTRPYFDIICSYSSLL